MIFFRGNTGYTRACSLKKRFSFDNFIKLLLLANTMFRFYFYIMHENKQNDDIWVYLTNNTLFNELIHAHALKSL